MISNPYLKKAAETLLSTANPNCEPYFGATAFHKMMFLLYEGLKKRRIDLKLPYSWYRYGPFMDATEFERQSGIYLSDYAPETGSACLTNSVPCSDISSEEINVIEQESRKLVVKYQERGQYKTGYLDLLLDDAYKYAPFKFQKSFNSSHSGPFPKKDN